jgi:hypothetical protein
LWCIVVIHQECYKQLPYYNSGITQLLVYVTEFFTVMLPSPPTIDNFLFPCFAVLMMFSLDSQTVLSFLSNKRVEESIRKTLNGSTLIGCLCTLLTNASNTYIIHGLHLPFFHACNMVIFQAISALFNICDVPYICQLFTTFHTNKKLMYIILFRINLDSKSVY